MPLKLTFQLVQFISKCQPQFSPTIFLLQSSTSMSKLFLTYCVCAGVCVCVCVYVCVRLYPEMKEVWGLCRSKNSGDSLLLKVEVCVTH